LSNSRRAIELAKTVLILLLSLNALFLAWQTGLFNDVFAAFPVIGNVIELVRGTTSPVEVDGATIKEAARPMTIIITNEQGERFGVRNDTELRNFAYDRAISILGEALGSASSHSEVTEEQWREALSKSGVFFEYIKPVRLSVLDGWLGANMPDALEDVKIRRIFVSFGEERSRIYYQEYINGLFFGADTASTAGKAQELYMFLPNGAMFAFETGLRGSERAPYMLITSQVYHPDVRSVAAGTQEQLLEASLFVFGHFVAPPSYFSGDVLVCRGATFNISVYLDGMVTYRRTDILTEDSEAQELSLSEMIEQARMITADSIGEISGDAEILFESIEYFQGVYTVYFGYYIAGGRVYLNDDKYASVISFTSGIISEAELNFRNFTYSGYSTRLLPQRQALAAAGGEFILSYSDTGPEILVPSWAKVWF